ncbi:P-loop containing nucleoside triphosphate hydrolase protein [Coniochaeta sp. 2T2.1]|nr:P-loop containing nucleoside triphosphate hydrolase protein [Coniochaeta sp. 2T2.1]
MAEACGKTSSTPDPDAGGDLVRTHGARPDLPPGLESGEAGDRPAAATSRPGPNTVPVMDNKKAVDDVDRGMTSKVSYLALYRYADIWDIVVVATSALCAIAAGAALPLLSVLFGNLATAFQDIATDTISYGEFMSRLNQNILYYVYIGIAEFGAVFLSTVGFHHTGERIARKVREEYLAAILRQNMAYFDNLGAGEVTTRISADVNLVQDGISQKVGLTMSAVAAFVSSVIIAYIKYWKLALIATPSIICLVGVMVFGFRCVVDLTAKAIQSSGDGSSIAGEAFSSIRTVAAFGSHEKHAAQYDSHLKAAEKHGVRMQVVQGLMLASLGAILFMTQGLCLWQGARFLVERQVHVGQVLTIMMAVINGSFSLGGIAPHIQAFASAMAAASRIYSTIDRESPIDPTSREGKIVPDKIEGHIELRNVTHVFPSRPEVVVAKDVNLVIPAGQTTALVGPSGSGKSTVISLLERFYDPVRGAILLDGHDIQSLELRWLRQQMSLVSQEPAIFSTTVLENVKMGLPRSVYEGSTADETLVRELVEKAARMANAHDFIISLPEGYDTSVGEQGLLLSGGQKQRIAIARAVVGNPKILLLDEATSALDTKSEQVVQAALDKAAAGRTTIVIAHRLSTIRSADNIVVLAGGRVVEQGTHDKLTDANGLYSRLVQAQSFHKEEQSFLAMSHAEVSETEDEGADCEGPGHVTPREGLSDTKEVIEAKAGSDSAPKAAGGSLQVTFLSLIKFIGSFNRPERKPMVVGLIFVIVSGGLTPAQSVIYSKAIASLSLPLDLSDEIRTQANLWALLLFVLGVTSLLTNSIHLVVFGISVEKMIHRARAKAFRTILRQDVEFFDREENSTGALLSFLSTETKNLAGISGVTLSTILILAVWLTAASVIALALGWKLALVCIAIVPLVMGCGFWRVAMLADFQARAQKAYEASTSYACEAITAVRTIASLGKEDAVLASYHRQLLLQVRAGVVPSLKSALLYALAQGVYYMCTALAFWYGGTLLARHEYSIFQFFVCFTQIVFSVNSASAIFASAPDLAKAKNAAAEFEKLLHRTTAADGGGRGGGATGIESMEGCIEFRRVCFRYPTRPTRDVVSDLSFTVRPGQYAALVGASGCGKSTTIALLERFYDVLSGCVCVDGQDISSLDIHTYRTHLALVSQEPMIYHGTIRENILIGTSDPNVTEEEIVKACKDADIYDLVLSLPNGLDTLVGHKGTMVSGGQKQRIAIARALVRNPKILLLDEATSALDSESERVVQSALDAAARGRTTIAVAHRLSTIQKADVIFVMDQGRITESGTHHELMRNRGRYSELVEQQAVERSSQPPT